MNKKLYVACAGAFSLATLGCSGDNVSGSSEDPNVLTAYNASSSSVAENSSSSVIGTSSSSFVAERDDLWNPEAGNLTINMARYAASLPANTKPDGHWSLETDSSEGGKSSVTWPVDFVRVEDEGTLINACDGICGIAVLDRGTMTYSPFTSIGFVLAKDGAGAPVPVDVSDWGGVCISYTSVAAPLLELDLGDSINSLLQFGLPNMSLPKTRTPEVVTKCYEWKDFKLPTWVRSMDLPEYWLDNTGEKAAKQLVAVRFKIQASPGQYEFNIKSLGTYSDQVSNPGSSSSAGVSPNSSPSSGSTSPAASSDLWNGVAGEATVKTGLYAEGAWKAKPYGKWYDYTDKYEGGNSSFSWWNYQSLDDYESIYFEYVVDYCKGMCSDVVLDNGGLEREPFALFGFQLAHNDSGIAVPVDVSNWGGICVTYSTDIPITLDLDPVSLEVDFDTASSGFYVEDDGFDIYKWPSVVLPISSAETSKCFAWSDFKQTDLDNMPNGEKFKISGEEVAKRVVTMRFIIKGKNGDQGKFNIKALGTNRR